MADLIKIPVTNGTPAQKFVAKVDDKVLTFFVRWNDRFARWLMDIMGEDETPILMGVPLHIDTDLMGRFRSLSLPQGLMILFDTTEKIVEADRDALGDKALLLFRGFE